jgi:hypothetical protein
MLIGHSCMPSGFIRGIDVPLQGGHGYLNAGQVCHLGGVMWCRNVAVQDARPAWHSTGCMPEGP